MTEEIWADVLDRPGYQISSLGRSRRRLRSGSFRDLVNVLINQKYYQSSFCLNGKKAHMLTHRAVAKTFIPNPENKPQVNHKNGIKTDNRVENLEWVTHLENARHAVDTGLYHRGEQQHLAKLKERQVIEIRLSPLSTSSLAKKYGVNYYTIDRVRKGSTWRHVQA